MPKISITKEQAEALHHLLNCCTFLKAFNSEEDLKNLSTGEGFIKGMEKAKAAGLYENNFFTRELNYVIIGVAGK